MEVKQILEKVRESKEEKKYFYALQISSSLVKSCLWAVDQGQVKVLAFGKVQTWQDSEELVEAVDESLSSASKKLFAEDDELEPDKVILGLPSAWIQGEKIVESKIPVLKDLSQKLGLVPVGFVVTVEAIVHYLKTVEGVPSSVILGSLGKEELFVTLVKLGKIIGYHEVKRSGDLGADLVEGLSRFVEKDHFPARILLYLLEEESDLNLEKAKQELIEYPWQDRKGTFLHLPKVEVLPSDFDIKAIALAGGREVARAEGLEVEKLAAKPEEKETKKESEPEIAPEAVFGFVRGEDIAQKDKQEIAEPVSPKPEFRDKTPMDKQKKRRPSVLSSFKFRGIKLPRIKLPKPPRLWVPGRFPAIITLVGVMILIIGGILGALYWYLPRAEVLLLVAPQRIEKELKVKLDPALDNISQKDLRIPANKLEVVLEGQKERGTTGAKTVGESAKGEVIIYNGTSGEQVLEAETIITSPAKIEFSLNEKVSIASQSGTAADPVPGKAEVKVTAVEIGTEGNLAAETEFSVADFSKSDLVAENKEAFSGGISREIQVVSKDDQDKLREELIDELNNRALEKLSVAVPEREELLKESVSVGEEEESFTHSIGEETTEIGLTLGVKATALTFNRDELEILIEEEVKESLTTDFEYQKEKTEVDFELESINEDGTADYLVNFKANLMPKLDLEDIKGRLTGKRLFFGQNYLKNLPHVDQVEIKISPRLPEKLITFPRVTERIRIETQIK